MLQIHSTKEVLYGDLTQGLRFIAKCQSGSNYLRSELKKVNSPFLSFTSTWLWQKKKKKKIYVADVRAFVSDQSIPAACYFDAAVIGWHYMVTFLLYTHGKIK